MIDPPKRKKKLTGTKIGAILGFNPWSTAFECWCDITGVFKKPFEENKYTLAGQAIEPIVIAYLDKRLYFGRGEMKSPEEWFGKDKQAMKYDHFDDPIFGGMWDARTKNAVFELKTTKRIEDWIKDGAVSPPEYYKVQAALYAYLMGLDTFYLVGSFLNDTDYDHPEQFVPTAQNTVIVKYSLAEEYPRFNETLDYLKEWYQKHVIGGVSPEWDPKKDAEILKTLTTKAVKVSESDPIGDLLRQIEPLQAEIAEAAAVMKPSEDKLKALKAELQKALLDKFGTTDKVVTVSGTRYVWKLSRSAPGIDSDRLKADGLYDKYLKPDGGYRLTSELIKGE